MTRDKNRSRILNSLITEVRNRLEETDDDEELKQILMKLYLDLQKRKRSLVTVEGEE